MIWYVRGVDLDLLNLTLLLQAKATVPINVIQH
jgi:hypothetical protein